MCFAPRAQPITNRPCKSETKTPVDNTEIKQDNLSCQDCLKPDLNEVENDGKTG
jgi:hypothetical protein